jgi:Ring finger domain
MNVEEARRQRYRDRQERIRQQRQEGIRQQRGELIVEMREQMRRIGQYDMEQHDGSSNEDSPFHQIDVLGEQLLQNTHQFQQLGREIFEECKASWQELLETLEEMRLTVVEQGGRRRSNKIPMYLERIDTRRRMVLRAMEQGERDQIQHDEDIEGMQNQLRRLLEQFRQQARDRQTWNSLSMQREVQAMSDSNQYRSSTGRILTSTKDINDNLYSSTSETTNDFNNGSPSLLLANFDGSDNDVVPIHDVMCVVCIVDYQNGDEILRNAICEPQSACNHFFHKECITAWIQMSWKRECPCCRRPFVVTA